MELLGRCDESTYPAVAMYPTPESPHYVSLGVRALALKRHRQSQAKDQQRGVSSAAA